MRSALERLCAGNVPSAEETRALLACSDADAQRLFARAREVREAVYGKDVYLRGLIELTNFCKNDCLYCGIRRSNRNARRYRLADEEVLACAEAGYRLGLRTVVLQGGEDAYFTDERLCGLVRALKAARPDRAVTLSMGERSAHSYRALFAAGADRYLLRHETATQAHYQSLHPPEMSFAARMECLNALRRAGFQTGCGFMVGSPGQTAEHLSNDLAFISRFRPEMIGIGPFIPHRDTPFAGCAAGSVEATLRLIAILRLLVPDALIPATTALSALDPRGCERGLLAGANVVMPNLTPPAQREKYDLYAGKADADDARRIDRLCARIEGIGYRVSPVRGDHAGISSTDGEAKLTRKKGETTCTTPIP